MTIDKTVLDSFKELLPPTGWMKAVIIGAEERKSQRGLDMFEVHYEVIDEYNQDPDNFENTLGYRISSVAVYPNAEIQGEKAKATGQAFQAFVDALELDNGSVVPTELINREVMIRVVYEKGQDGKDRPKIAFGGYAPVNEN